MCTGDEAGVIDLIVEERALSAAGAGLEPDAHFGSGLHDVGAARVMPRGCVQELRSQFGDRDAFQKAIAYAGLAEGPFVAVGQVAGVRDEAGGRTDAREPAIGLAAGRAGTAEIGEDDVWFELVGEFGAEHDVGCLADDANAGYSPKASGEHLGNGRVLVDDQHGESRFAVHELSLGRASRRF